MGREILGGRIQSPVGEIWNMSPGVVGSNVICDLFLSVYTMIRYESGRFYDVNVNLQ